MTDPIKPALTRDEWKEMGTEAAVVWDGVLHISCEQAVPVENPHGLAALALHEQPFGFTWADVEALDLAISDQRDAFEHDEDNSLAHHHLRQLESLRDRIAALLPPREGVSAEAEALSFDLSDDKARVNFDALAAAGHKGEPVLLSVHLPGSRASRWYRVESVLVNGSAGTVTVTPCKPPR